MSRVPWRQEEESTRRAFVADLLSIASGGVTAAFGLVAVLEGCSDNARPSLGPDQTVLDQGQQPDTVNLFDTSVPDGPHGNKDQGNRDTTSPPGKWWIRSLRSKRPWVAGPSYNDKGTAQYQSKIAYPDCANAQSGGHDNTWDEVCGGNATEPLNAVTIMPKSQCDVNSTQWGNSAKTLGPDNGFIIMSCDTIPKSSSPTTAAVFQSIIDGNYDAYYARFGARLKKALKNLGWTDFDLFCLRPNHEMNQSNAVQVYANTRALYRAAMERTLERMRDGWGGRMRVVHSPARTANIGPYQDWIPQSKDGGVDMLTISFHPGSEITNLAQYFQFLNKWDSGSYGTIQDCLAACKALNLPYCNPEWSPREDWAATAKYACPASDIVGIYFNKFLREQAAADNLVYEAIYSEVQYDPLGYKGPDQAGKDAWKRWVALYPELWKGDPLGSAPHLSTSTVNASMSGSQVQMDVDVLASTSGNEPRVIYRIASDFAGAATSAITGAGSNGKLRVTRNGAGPGVYTATIEISLASIPYLMDQTIKLTIT